jgi:hypothetical protein
MIHPSVATPARRIRRLSRLSLAMQILSHPEVVDVSKLDTVADFHVERPEVVQNKWGAEQDLFKILR